MSQGACYMSQKCIIVQPATYDMEPAARVAPMNKTTALSIAGLTLIAALLIGCGTLGLAVRSGVVREQLIAFPPNSRYQLIVRVGNDALPWDAQSRKPTAINMWVHGRG